MISFLLALVVLAGPTPPAPFAANEGGGRAELEEGGRDLERGVVLGGHGRDGTMRVVGWKRDRVEGRKDNEGRNASYCLSPGG